MLRVYGIIHSQPTRALLWLLRIKKLPHELIPTVARSPKPNGSRHPSFLSKFPSGVIPTIEEITEEEHGTSTTNADIFRLEESNAIMSYLCTKHKWYDMYPHQEQNQHERAKVDAILHWHHTNTRTITIAILPFYNPRMASLMPKEYLEQKRRVAVRSLKILESKLAIEHKDLEDGKGKGYFLCGNNVTIADLCVYGDLVQISPRMKPPKEMTQLFPIGQQQEQSQQRQSFKRILRWMKQMETTVPEYNSVHKELEEFYKNYGEGKNVLGSKL